MYFRGLRMKQYSAFISHSIHENPYPIMLRWAESLTSVWKLRLLYFCYCNAGVRSQKYYSLSPAGSLHIFLSAYIFYTGKESFEQKCVIGDLSGNMATPAGRKASSPDAGPGPVPQWHGHFACETHMSISKKSQRQYCLGWTQGKVRRWAFNPQRLPRKGNMDIAWWSCLVGVLHRILE